MKKHYYIKLLVSVLIVCFVTSILTSAFSFYNFSQKLVMKSSEDNLKSLSIINKQISELIASCATIPAEHKAFDDALELATNHFSENYATVLEYYDDVISIRSDIDSVFISSQEHDYFLGNIADGPLFYAKIGVDISINLAENFMTYESHTMRFLSEMPNGHMYLFTKTPITNPNHHVIGNINCGIALDRFGPMISTNANSTIGTVVLLDENDCILYGFDTISGMMCDAPAVDFAGYVKSGKQTQTITYQGDSYLLSILPSEIPNITFASLVPLSLVTGDARIAILKNSMQTVLLCAVLSALLSLLLSKRLYVPIRDIVDFSKQRTGVQPISDELGYIRNTIDTMDSSNQALNRIINDSKYIIQYRNLCALIYDIPMPNDNFNTLEFEYEYFTAVLLRVSFKGETKNQMTRNLLTSALIASIDNALHEYTKEYKVFQTLQNDVMLLINMPQLEIEETPLVKRFNCYLQNIVEKEEFECISHINIGVGSTVRELSMVSISYEDALYALEYAIINRSEKIHTICFEQLENDDQTQHKELELVSRAITKLRAEGNVPALTELLNQTKESFHIEKTRYSIDDINKFFLQLVFENNRQASQLSAKIALAIREKNAVVGILNEPTVERKCEYIKDYLVFLIRISTEQEVGGSATEKKIFKACSYIEEHYMEDVSLQEIADFVGLNYAYFSNAFKVVKGKKFVEYLNDIRLEHAIVLMKTTKETLNIISQQCGFLSAQHFGLVFKSRYKMSPGQYRSTHFSNTNAHQ